MKSILFNLVLSLCVVAVCGCNDESEVQDHQVKKALSARTPEEAMVIAKSFLSGLNTRSSRSLDSLHLQIVSEHKLSTRGGGELEDTSFYIVNGNLGEGYVLLSGNRHVPPVVSYSPYGNLIENDLREDSELWGALNRYNRRKQDNEPRDFIFIGAAEEYEKHLEEFFRWRNELVVAPMLKTEWGQKHPYNSQTPIIDGQRCVAGCVPTAVAQILNHYKFPDRIGNYQVDWGVIENKDKVEEGRYNAAVGGLFYNIGQSLGVTWGLKLTYVGISAVTKEYFERLGYNQMYKEYNDGRVQKNLLQGHPILVLGVEPNADPRKSVGHAWVIDGWQQWWQYAQYASPKHPVLKRRALNYYHVNWGWDGKRNGYFVSGVFDTSEADSFDHNLNLGDERKYNFSTVLGCVYDLYPRK